MKRAVAIAVSVAVFTTLLGGLAAAESSRDGLAARGSDTVVRVNDGSDVDVPGIWRRCRKLMGDDELTVAAHERCVQIWKRWCTAHPRARHCWRPVPPPPPCRILDRSTDRRCLPEPCPTIDRVVDRRCLPDPCPVVADAYRLCFPPPCPTTDRPVDLVCVPDPCVSDGEVIKCVPVPTERPVLRPTDQPAERPAGKPADTRPKDRIFDQPIDRPTDRAGNDVHLRAVAADS